MTLTRSCMGSPAPRRDFAVRAGFPPKPIAEGVSPDAQLRDLGIASGETLIVYEGSATATSGVPPPSSPAARTEPTTSRKRAPSPSAPARGDVARGSKSGPLLGTSGGATDRPRYVETDGGFLVLRVSLSHPSPTSAQRPPEVTSGLAGGSGRQQLLVQSGRARSGPRRSGRLDHSAKSDSRSYPSGSRDLLRSSPWVSSRGSPSATGSPAREAAKTDGNARNRLAGDHPPTTSPLSSSRPLGAALSNYLSLPNTSRPRSGVSTFRPAASTGSVRTRATTLLFSSFIPAFVRSPFVSSRAFLRLISCLCAWTDYDALTLSFTLPEPSSSFPPPNLDFDTTVFPCSQEGILAAALRLVSELRKEHAYTDTATFA